MSVRFILTFAFLASCATSAVAHAFLKHAQPGAGAVLKVAPGGVSLIFSEELEPVSSGVAVIDSAGHSVGAGRGAIRGNAIEAPIRPLPPGKYRIVWHAVSIDAHRTEGSYSFTVKP